MSINCLSRSGANLLEVQESLSKAQAIPIIGPIAVSPSKAVLSVAQIVASIALAVISHLCAVVYAVCDPGSKDNPFAVIIAGCLAGAGAGMWSLAYSVANLLSLGIVGWYVEGERANWNFKTF